MCLLHPRFRRLASDERSILVDWVRPSFRVVYYCNLPLQSVLFGGHFASGSHNPGEDDSWHPSGYDVGSPDFDIDRNRWRTVRARGLQCIYWVADRGGRSGDSFNNGE